MNGARKDHPFADRNNLPPSAFLIFEQTRSEENERLADNRFVAADLVRKRTEQPT